MINQLSPEELIIIAEKYAIIDPSLAGAIISLATCRKADIALRQNHSDLSVLEEWFNNFTTLMSGKALEQINYAMWLVNGGTENER